jgi:hypothetical protein
MNISLINTIKREIDNKYGTIRHYKSELKYLQGYSKDITQKDINDLINQIDNDLHCLSVALVELKEQRELFNNEG